VVQPDNELVLMGQLLRPAQLRVTPAGIPIARFVLVHRSRRSEAGSMRDVECRIGVVASGSALADIVAARSAGSWCRVRGFMNRAGYRSPETRLELHALEIEAVDETGLKER
jgi:primosomal replication protein N